MAENWGENDKIVDAGDFGANDEVVQDGALTRGFKKAGQSMKMTAQLTGGDTEGAAQTVKDAADYARANPGSKEGAALMDAWNKGDGVTGAIGNVARKVGDDYSQAKGFIPGLKAVGRDIKALGEGVVEQVPNMIAPTVGMVAGGAAGGELGAATGGAVGAAVGGVGAVPGAAVGGTVGTIGGGWLGASAGNALVEGGDQIQTAIQNAGIDPTDTKAVQAYLDANRGQLLKQTAIKGGVIGAVDTATAGLAHGLLTGPAKAATDRALAAMGVDLADKAAVKAARKSDEFASLIANDATYQASLHGPGHIAREATAAALEPAGEFAGEYLGTGLANDQWDTKNAALEALSSIGQSTGMHIGQKAIQYATRPRSAQAEGDAQADATFDTAPEAPPQQGPIPLLPAPVYEAGSDGVIRTTQDQNTATQAQRQAEADRMDRINRGEVLDVTPVPKRSEQMGLDPNAGPLTAAAADAVDSGASDHLAQQAALQQAAEVAQKGDKGSKAAEQINPETGEISQGDLLAGDPATDLQARLDYVRQQARATGWDAKKIAERDRLQGELAKLQPQQQEQGATGLDDLGGAGKAIADNLYRSLWDRVQEGKTSEKDGMPESALLQGAKMLKDAGSLRTPEQFREVAPLIQQAADMQGPERNAAIRQVLSDWHAANAPQQAEQQAAPANVQQGIQQAQAKADTQQAQDDAAQAPADIKAVVAKQIPQMSTAELQQAIDHYGPDHQRTAKLQKELAKRSNQPQEEVNAGEAQRPAEAQAAQPAAQAPQGAQPVPAAPAPAVEAKPTNLKDAIAKVREQKKPRQPAMPRQDFESTAGVGKVSAVQERYDGGKFGVSWASTDVASADSMEQASAIAKAVAESGADNIADMRKAAERHLAESAAATAPRIEGKDIGDGWSEFHKDSGTVGIPRADMPQIKAEHRGAMVNFLNARGVQHQEETVPAASLKPTQAEFSREKVAKARDFEGGNRSILVSRDGHVLDGHHQWMAAREKGEDVKVIRLDAPIRELVSLAHEFPSSTVDAASEQATASVVQAHKVAAPEKPAAKSRASAKQKAEAEVKARADYFTPGNIVKGYSGHDRVVSYQQPDSDGRWSVTVRAVRKQGDQWVDVPDERERTHATPPDARELKAGPVVRAEPEQANQHAPESAGGEPAQAAPEAETAAKDADRFADNKLFTADKVAAARARMKSKLGQLNSGIDPELLVDGMTIAGAYIESGVRNFTQYAKAMVEDLGDGVKPYLLSFWEGARNYPGLDTSGMTDAAESARQHEALLTPAHRATEAVGTVAEKPKARTKKTGAKGDMVLTQDWGVEHINGYGDATSEEGNDTKDAFLRETRNYLNAVADALRAHGFEPHEDRKGKPEKPVSVNAGGMAGSGDVTLVMRNPDNGNNAYITIGETSLRGAVPTTPSGIAVMYRVGTGADRYAARAGNTWAPVDLSANDLAALVSSRARPVAQAEENQNARTLPTEQLSGAGQSGTEDVAAAGNGNRQSLDAGLAEDRQGAAGSGPVSGRAEGAGGSGADGVQQSGQPAPGAARDSGAVRPERQPADAVADPATAETSPKPELDGDHTIEAADIGKGGLSKKYRDNIEAIRILKTMATDGRVATPAERKQIARYVGWGALKGVFDPQNKQWAKEHAELRELLTDAEYKAARASTLNAHYTSPTVVGGIYQALERMGFTRGRVLEPSVGVGNFYGLMPASLRKQSQLHGVELDPLTSQIAAALYPSAKIAQATGFQNYQVPAEYFDLAVGNPPFGSEPLVDDERSPYSGASIHNYFFAKSIDKLRPGGLLAMVVSHNFLDAKNASTRQWIAERANLVSAVRLPRTAFKENAGTEVVTDIVVFQKRGQGEAVDPTAADWVKVGQQSLTDAKTGAATQHSVSQYFLDNPDNVLGTPSAAGSMYRAGEYTVEPSGDLAQQLKDWAGKLPEGIYQPVERTHEPESAAVSVPDGVKVGSYFVNDKGQVQMRGPDVMGNRTASEWAAPNAKAAERMAGMIGLRDALRAQMRLEKSPEATPEQIEAHRRQLNQLYDAFQSKYGYLNDPTNRRIFLDDTESALLLALEFDYDRGVSKAVAEREDIEARPPKAVKADIFSRRVMFPPTDDIKVQTAKDALLASLNYKGRLDLDYMASLYDKPVADITQELGDVVFNDPVNGMVMADEYLSGDVKTKLAEAEAAALDDPAYKRNVAALKKVIPADKKPSEIHAALGAPFIPAELFEQFAKEVTGATVRTSYVKATGQWIVDVRSEANPSLNTGKWGISKMPATAILQRTMAGQGVVVTETHRNADGSTTTVVLERETEAAREKQAAMRAEWQRWLWSDGDRADQVAALYNDKMNRIVVRKFDGAHMTFPGMSPAMELLPHQKNAVWRALQSRQVLLDHVVGAGKTFEVVATFMELRRLGIARKPMIAVPNHLTLQWRSEFSRLYPAANVLAATPDDFAKGNREKFFSKIVTGDWDAVIVGHSSLKKIALPPETEKAVLEEQITEIAGAIEDMKRGRGDRNIIRDMEGIKARLDARMKQRLQALGERDKVVTFDELGVDAFAVDELHEFKNLFYNSTMERVPGMGNPAGSDKAFDLFVKLQHLFNTFGDKAPIIGATGTPVSNSLVEMFNMQRFLQYPLLKAEGLNVFDAWARQFGSVESLYEVSPSGTGYRQSSRFAKFKNLPALMAHYQTFADTVTLDDLKTQEEARGTSFPVPKVANGRPTNIVAKRSPQVSSFMGVPELDIQGGQVQFGYNAASDTQRASIEKSADGNSYLVQVSVEDADGKSYAVSLGSAKTEEDARQMVVEAALSPKIKVDPQSILGQFANLKQLTKETKGKVNALSLTGQANKAGLDYRLIDPSAPDFAGSKINLAVDRMMATYRKWADDKGTQLVFCDLSVPLSSRSGFGSKERRIYVRDGGALTHKKGTMHTVVGSEELPFFVVKEGAKDAKSFALYDAATGLRLAGGYPSKVAATDWAAQTLANDAKRQKWIDARDALGDIQQDEIDDYNNAHEIDTEETEAISLADIAGASGASGFSVYDDIKAKLIAKGVPEREIAFIHDYGTPAAKDKLFKAVNNGSVRFLLGSTPKMGAGTNVQKLLVGLHHIDAPWRPSDLEQREGRIIRRGNSLYERDPQGFEVEIYRYATEQTYDTRRWQILEHKARGIEQLRNYDGTLNEIDDIEGEAANSADMKAAASGDPLILEETQLRNDVRRLEALQASHADEAQTLVRRARDQQRFANEYGPKHLAEFQELKAAADANPVKKDEFAGLTVNGKRVQDRDDAVKAIKRAMDRVFTEGGSESFTYRGIEFTLDGTGEYAELGSPTGTLDSFRPAKETLPSAAGFLTRFANYINRLPGLIEDLTAKIAEAKQAAVEMREQAAKPFEQAAELEAAREAHKRVQRRLIAKGPDIPATQKPMLEQAMERQKEALREQGYGEALDEFLGSNADRLQYSFAGRNAQGANLLALSTAQQRIATGEDAEAVRRDTGWHRGADGKWRFEISDDQAAIAQPGATAGAIIDMAHVNALSDGRKTPTVGDVLEHPQLFAAYPHLANIPISVTPDDVSVQARLRRLATGPKVEVNASMPRASVASAVLHELQHGIQIAEGFAMGGSAKAFVSDFDKTGAATYRRLAGEVEARNTQARLNMTPRLRRDIAPEESADVPADRVLVTFNGRDLVDAPLPQNLTSRAPMTAPRLARAFDLQFPQLGKAMRAMLERGKQGKRGGVVLIDSADPLRIAHAYSQKTGKPLSDAIQVFEDAGRINGFYDARSGLTFLVGPNLDPITAPAVLLHEMTHGQQRAKIDRQAGDLLMNRATVKDADLRAFLDRVAARMIDAGESANVREAAAYIVEQAVIEGRSQGHQFADSRFLSWVDQTIGRRVGDLLRGFLGAVRQWMLGHGMGLGQISVDDLVAYAMAGMQRAAQGDVRGSGQAFSRAQTLTDAFKRWFGDSKVVDAEGKPLVVYHGTAADFSTFSSEFLGEGDGNADFGDGFYFTDRPDAASGYAQGEGGNVMPVYLNIQNPATNEVMMSPEIQDVLDDGMGFDDLADALAERGYDGIVFTHKGGGREFVVFKPEQIKSATGNRGSFDAGNPDILFSRAGLRDITSKATLELNRTFSAPGKLSWWHKTIGTMYNLAQRSPAFKPVFESAQGFIDDVSHYANDAADLAPKLLPKLDTWRDITKSPVSAEDNKAVAKPVFEGTLMWARDVDGKPVRVESLAERAAKLTADEKADILLAQGKIPPGLLKAWQALSPEQFAKMIDSRYETQMLKAGIVWTDAELRSLFKLNDAQVDLYHQFRDATNRSLDTMARADMLRFGGDDVKALRDEVMSATDASQAARVLRDHLAMLAATQPDRAKQLLNTAHGMMDRAEKVAQLQAEGYAPLSRFGKYTVDVVDANGERQYFSLFETKREANLMAEQMRGAFPGATVSQGTLSEESYKLFAGITPETLELFGNALGFDSEGDSARDQAFQEYLRLTKTNRSAMRRLIHRKGIAGYSEDVGRVLASFIYSNSRQTAAGLHMGDLSEAVNAIPKEQGELKDAAVRLADYIKNPQEEAQAIRGLLFAQYLGGSVASAFVNMTQPAAVTFPWLSQYGGARKAASELARAAKQMATKGHKYEPDLAKALHDAEEDGTVSPQEVHQLMAQARGSGSLRAGDGTRVGDARALAANSLTRLSVAWGKLFGAAEQANRRVTFIAAYRMAKDKGISNPAEFARRAVKETQFVYSKASKMQWGRGAVGGTLMTFKTYSVAYLELMHRLWNQGEAGSQERKDGRKAALLMIATMMLLGGAGGLPFEDDLEDAIDGMAQIAGYNFSTQKAKQEFLEDLFGRDLAAFIDKGITGLPGMPLDVSGRLGMGNLIPGTGLLKESNDHTRDVMEIVGPVGDFASRIASGARKAVSGDIGGGLLDVAPTAVRNLAKGVDMGTTGMYRDAKGYKVLDTNTLEAALKAIGFQPSSVATIQEANQINQGAKAFYNLRAQEIRAQWAEGIFEKDPAKVQEARDAVAEWNAKNPDQRMVIRMNDILRRVREMSKSKDQRIAATAPKAMRQAMREDYARVRADLE